MHGHPEQVSKQTDCLSSPCSSPPSFEIEAYFLVAGTMGWWTVLLFTKLYRHCDSWWYGDLDPLCFLPRSASDELA